MEGTACAPERSSTGHDVNSSVNSRESERVAFALFRP